MNLGELLLRHAWNHRPHTIAPALRAAIFVVALSPLSLVAPGVAWSALDQHVCDAHAPTAPPEVQYQYWKQRLQQVLASDEFTNEQRVHIDALNALLSPDLFSGDDQAGAVLETWGQHAVRIFSRDELQRLVGEADDAGARTLGRASRVPGGGGGGSPACNCNKTFDFCSSLDECKGKCEVSGSGCGVLFANRCNGICTLIAQPAPASGHRGLAVLGFLLLVTASFVLTRRHNARRVD